MTLCEGCPYITKRCFYSVVQVIVVRIVKTISQVSSTEMKLEDISNAVLEELAASCAECGITSDIIDKQSFACFRESPKYVTYRARLSGTSETDSGSLISLIEEWVSGGRASIIVTGVLMTVDSECSVAISSLSEGECSPIVIQTPTSSIYTIQPTTDSIPVTTPPTIDITIDAQTPSTDSNTDTETLSTATDQASSGTEAIVGGVVAVVIVLIIAITVIVIVIVVLLMKSRRGDLAIKNTEK